MKSRLVTPRCYIGRGRVVFNSGSLTTARSMQGLQSLPPVEVDRREFVAALHFGATHFSLRAARVLAQGGRFRAWLECVRSSAANLDIKVRDHRVLEIPFFRTLLSRMDEARRVVGAPDVEAAYRFVYCAERRVFATDGEGLFIGVLPRALPYRLIVSADDCRRLCLLWNRRNITNAMLGSRGLLVKNEQLAGEVLGVDSAIPNTLYRATRQLRICEGWATIARSGLLRALSCLRASGSCDAVLSVQRDAITLTSAAGSMQLSASAVNARLHGTTVKIDALLRALQPVPRAESITLGQSSFDGTHLAVMPASAHGSEVASCVILTGRTATLGEPAGAACLSAGWSMLDPMQLSTLSEAQLMARLREVRDGDAGASAWLNDDSDDSPGSIARLCAAVGVDVERLRDGMRTRLTGRATA